jgi:hypothetical protein
MSGKVKMVRSFGPSGNTGQANRTASDRTEERRKRPWLRPAVQAGRIDGRAYPTTETLMKLHHTLRLGVTAMFLIAAGAAQAQVTATTNTCKAVVQANACATSYQALIDTINGNADEFTNAKDVDGLVGKVVVADCKMQQAKSADALLKLQDVYNTALALASAAKPKLSAAGWSAIQTAHTAAYTCTLQN